MARKMTEVVKFPINQVSDIPIHMIDTESFENSRSPGWTAKNEDPNAQGDFETFRKGMKLEGQLTPVIVRPHPKPNPKQPYQLVAGWRRVTAKLKNAEDDGEKNPTIRAEVKELTDRQARKVNGIENLDREDLNPADKCWLVYRVYQEALSAKEDPTDASIADELGLSQAYAGRLLGIGRGVQKGILEHWRKKAVRPLTIAEMQEVAKLADKPAEQQKLYTELCKQAESDGSEDGKEKKQKGPSAWIDPAKKAAEKIGTLIAMCESMQLIELDELKLDSDFVALCVEAGLIKIGKKGDGVRARTSISNALKAGYQAQKKEGSKTEAA